MRKKILKWFLVLFVIVFLFSSFTSSAAISNFEFEYVGSNFFVYEDYTIPYHKMNYFEKGSDIITIDSSVYVLPFSYDYDGVETNDIVLFSFDSFKWGYNTDNPYTSAQSRTTNGKTFYFVWISNCQDVEVTFDFADTPWLESTRRNIVYNLITSNSFVEVVPPLVLPWDDARPDIIYGLNSVTGYVENGIFYANWSALDSGAILNYNPYMQTIVCKPILLDFFFTDLETGEKISLSYPLSGAVKGSYFDVDDYSLQVELNRISGIPETYNLSFVTLTPYYLKRTNTLEGEILYVGSSARVYLDYNGKSDGTIYIPPDVPDIIIPEPEPEDPSWGIFGLLSNFFSSFFTNIGNLLKDLFIPSKEQLTSLFNDMELFFSEKLGFLWYPFDFAIEIATVLGQESSDSMIVVPPITINILGGIDLYAGGTFNMDETGIFTYVRFFTSAMLASGVLGLAMRKWSLWIGGHNE